jgi:hypothetical protein
MIRVLASGWDSVLAGLASSVKRELIVCSPFVGEDGVRLIRDNVPDAFHRDGRLTFVTNLSVKNVCDLSTDPRAVRALSDTVRATSVYHLPGLHAKAYVADDRVAVVTSANLTSGGMLRNFECGVEIRDATHVAAVRTVVDTYADLGALVPRDRLSRYCEALDSILDRVSRAKRAADSDFRRQFSRLLKPVEDELLRMRLARGPIHTVFARTIEYLLGSFGPMTTVQIHSRVQSLHPDLCDNTVDRVIDGKRFGKKWKHAVRTAQQQLKKRGKIELVGNKWQLAGA